MNDGELGSTGMVKLLAKKKKTPNTVTVFVFSAFRPRPLRRVVPAKEGCVYVWLQGSAEPNFSPFGDPSEDRFISLGRVLGAPCYRKESFYYPKSQKPETKTKNPNPHRGQVSASLLLLP